MRLRAIVTAALGTAGLLLTLPGSALAAQGEFIYSFDRSGAVQRDGLFDPAGRFCHRLDLPNRFVPAYRVQNRTDATAVVYLDDSCATDVFYVLRPGESAPAGVKVRSVTFSR
ncbi:hypothetical protein [Saccharopolyspora spinosa]|uniref:Beta/gamma crystallin n=1 Tax=Saccharopolyspora spinosa TaxID=60894 RepID=A0A2N3Y3V5_SACSN|nr:hypothetical protein [Saccharopolyspora spinosa]PKW17570.1 hypothetical protein A8926_5548 [Saccharopolyspora spinosa]